MKFCSIFLIFTAILTIAAEIEETQKKQGEVIQKIKQKEELLEYEFLLPDQEAKNTKESTFVGNQEEDLVTQKGINEKGNQMGNENENQDENLLQNVGNKNVHQGENQNGKVDQRNNTKTDQGNTKVLQENLSLKGINKGDLESQKVNKLGNQVENQNEVVDQDVKPSQKAGNKKHDEGENQNGNLKTPQEKPKKDKCKNASNCNLEKQKVEQKWRIKYLKKRISSLKRENKKLKRKLDVVGPFVEFFKIIPTLSYHTIQYILCHRAVNFDEFLKFLNQWS